MPMYTQNQGLYESNMFSSDDEAQKNEQSYGNFSGFGTSVKLVPAAKAVLAPKVRHGVCWGAQNGMVEHHFPPEHHELAERCSVASCRGMLLCGSLQGDLCHWAAGECDVEPCNVNP